MAFAAFIRTVFFYFFVLIVLRIMGKRELGALGPLDLVVTFIMAEAATIPIENPSQPIILGIVPIVTLMGLEMILSFLCLKSSRIRSIISGAPTVVIKDGRFVQSEMRKMRYSINDLLEQLRQKGYDSVLDVETAILESDGGLSVVTRPDRRPLQPADIGLQMPARKIAHVLVIDGEVNKLELAVAGLNERDLHKMLADQNSDALQDIFLAVLDEEGRLHLQKRW